MKAPSATVRPASTASSPPALLVYVSSPAVAQSLSTTVSATERKQLESVSSPTAATVTAAPAAAVGINQTKEEINGVRNFALQ